MVDILMVYSWHCVVLVWRSILYTLLLKLNKTERELSSRWLYQDSHTSMTLKMTTLKAPVKSNCQLDDISRVSDLRAINVWGDGVTKGRWCVGRHHNGTVGLWRSIKVRRYSDVTGAFCCPKLPTTRLFVLDKKRRIHQSFTILAPWYPLLANKSSYVYRIDE